VLVKLLN